MSRYRLLMVVLMLLSMTMACSDIMAQKPWSGGALKVSANQRYLQTADGKPFFWLGDTGWLLPERLDRAEAQYYLQKCRAAGYPDASWHLKKRIPMELREAANKLAEYRKFKKL